MAADLLVHLRRPQKKAACENNLFNSWCMHTRDVSGKGSIQKQQQTIVMWHQIVLIIL